MTRVLIGFGSASTHKALRNSEVLVKITETYWKGKLIFFLKKGNAKQEDVTYEPL